MKAGSLTHNAITIIQSKGQFPLAQACQEILANQYDNGIVCEALHYYAKEILPRVLPIFPALIYLSSKAVGAIPEDTSLAATAMMLITSSGDIHDDIVDNSKKKFGRKTLFGKYGNNIALLAGDSLLIQGTTALQKECDILPSERRKKIADLVAAAMFEIVKAEALETFLWQKENVTEKEHFEVISLKGGVAELHCRIGGIIGGGDDEVVEDLARFGRTIGVLSTLKEEFVDMTNPIELMHRIKHELPPYPMLCALKNRAVKEKIITIIKRPAFSIKDFPIVAEKVLGSAEVDGLIAEFMELGRKELADNRLLKNNCAKDMTVLLEALTVELAFV